MIRHIVLFRLKDFSCAEEKQNAANILRSELLSMSNKIQVIRELEIGLNEGENPSAYDISILSCFASWDDLKIYQVHPAHQAFIAFNKNYSIMKAIIDYEY